MARRSAVSFEALMEATKFTKPLAALPSSQLATYLRQSFGVPREELAAAVGVSLTTLIRFERAECRPRLLSRNGAYLAVMGWLWNEMFVEHDHVPSGQEVVAGTEESREPTNA